MKRFAMFFAFLVFVGLPMLQAQTVQITGKVTSSEDGNAVPGVSVVVKGTTIGTTTDFDGKYSLNVPSSATTLIYSFVGLKSQEVAIGGRNSIDVVLESDVVGLEEVVVTALGISREKKSLGYSTQEVKGEAVSTVKTANFMNALSGKVSGVQIKKNTNLGGSTNVVVRGNKSLTNSNQILYVVDGVPINNNIGSYLSQNSGSTGYDYGNAASDINPDDVESVNILKGSAATALYGSRGNGGVILITTKKGKKGEKGLGVSVSGNVTVSSIDKSTFPTYQKSYGAGYGPYYDTDDGYFYSFDANGDGTGDEVIPFTEDASFGAPFDSKRQVYGWYSFDPQSPWYNQARPWVAAKNDPSTFFETAVSYTSSVAIENTGDKGNYRLSYTNNNSTGIMPNSHLLKDNFFVNGSWKVNDRLTVNASASIIKTKGKGRNSTGYSDNLVGGFRQWWETNTDIKEQKQVWDLTHRNITWNYNADRNAPIFWDNPYWTRYKNYETDGRSRTIGYMSLNYKLTSWLDVLGRAAIDTYFESQDERRAVGSVATTFGLSRNDQGSGYLRRENSFGEYNFDLMLNFNKNLTESLNLNGLVGLSERRTNQTRYTASTEGGLAVADVYSLNNSASTPPFPTEVNEKVGVRSFYSSASLGYKSFLYLDGTYRYDYASTLPTNANKYSYPSITGSFLFADLLHKSWLSFGKVRLNWAKVGNLAPFNSLTDEYIVESPMNGAAYRLPATKNNPDLKPESTYSYEAGLEMNFFKGRVGFDLSLYQQTSKDQIMPVTLSQTTGYQFMYVNAGEIQNKGVELSLNGTPVQTPAFKWDITVNFAKNKNKVVSLYPGIENLQIASYQGGVTVNAAKGEPYGALKGTDYTYTADGQLVLSSSTGKPVKSSNKIIGNVTPDWTGGIQNTLTYKNLTFSFLVDVQKGGDIFSLDMYYGLSSGLYPETVFTNDLGKPVRNSLAEGGGYVIKGVNVNGDVVTPNTTRVAANTYSGFGYAALPNKAFIYDASYIKLREVSISYTLPSKLFSKGFIKGASLSAVGSNLWIIHKNLPYADPESGLAAGNAQGYSAGSLPSTRDFGFNVKFNF